MTVDAIKAAAIRNKARLESPHFNKDEFASPSREPSLAPPLRIVNETSTLSAREISQQNVSSSAYTIPPEVVEAARIMAESTPQQPAGDHADIAARIKQKYSHKLNDTNAPKHLGTPEGRLGAWAMPDSVGNSSEVLKRDSSYWMLTMPQLGSNPYAPSGYKVWRNVKDFGAKGDGKTDDTAAINAAISSGGRCGPNCGSSTIFPAVVYFPPGTYLISTPIIQYYNTQLLGDPISVPTILGASSFVGLGMITSDVYIGDNEEWYINTNNFLRNIRNFIIDVRNTNPSASVCGVHWQVAQGTSIENVTFYMLFNSNTPGNTQQGIYMENGSGGFLADLTFVGGNFGAYMGNQQFTTSHLIFVQCNTALQIHWDWAWTMQDFVIESCATGLTIVGGAGGAHSTGQGVGSLVLVDTIIANTPNGIVTSLAAENSTSFLLQNVGFFNVQKAVQDNVRGTTMLAGGNQVLVDSWGFGQINNATGPSKFVNGANIPAMTRPSSLLGVTNQNMKPNLFTRRRPTYYNVPTNKVMNVKQLGAKGDGVTDDTAALNAILDGAANTSSIVYFPHGVYAITSTLHVPVGSRIIGQAWSQIMARGSYFGDEANPRVAVELGKRGDVGILEVQDMLFTVSATSGATAGAVIVEWNIRQSTTGSAGMWDSHIRVGGAKGSGLQAEQCPKKTGKVNPNCKAASLLMHLTANSTAYLENVWIWTADHDMDKVTQDQIDVYAGRGLLIESKLAWLWGTAVEHCVFYQYQMSDAQNILMGMIQTESPYYQPVPQAPTPFKPGLFPNDPTFNNCTSVSCYTSWAVRIVDSSTIYMLGAGLYSWFSDYSKTCVDTNNCQQRGFEVVQSYDIWIYNLCTKAIVEMISPLLVPATMAADNKNGYLSSVLAWLQGAQKVSGGRHFTGFQIFREQEVDSMSIPYPQTCRTALTQTVECDDYVEGYASLGYPGSFGNKTLADSVCDPICDKSLKSWFDNVQENCAGFTDEDNIPLTLLGGRMWANLNATCLKDPNSPNFSGYCVDTIDGFSRVATIQDMPVNEVCSYCFMGIRAIMQTSAYSAYDKVYKAELDYINSKCRKIYHTDIKPSLFPPPLDTPCPAEQVYVTKQGDSCDSIALQHSVSSAAIFMANNLNITNCSSIPSNITLCLPSSCGSTYVIQQNDTCTSIERSHLHTLNTTSGDVRKYNPWVNQDCMNLWNASDIAYGHVICLSPQNGQHLLNASSEAPKNKQIGYAYTLPIAPPTNATIAKGTTDRCGAWYTAVQDDICVAITLRGPTTINIFFSVNPSLGTNTSQCDSKLVVGTTYCLLPVYNWDYY
ncbi:carbohydrate-binding module family 50 protein [Trichoderma harzianum CBS 226.95]|uniref:Carbohydrate-binding module family 50 protein n=1 Tax=Trichoderma harzianum CBS 226.95 TaxID=983964 RepID=A0A2T3ZS41_TRIHA|nr:carbohydrate-binding module family 50 protein [Trichoderma harzianum CBS 226.95]PTB47605.1 carbohydrate-binding module family 50 protein [Trichoderma harzianum CBS 226.95]